MNSLLTTTTTTTPQTKASSTTTTTSTTVVSNTNRHSENITIWSHITSCLLESWLRADDEQTHHADKKLLIIDSRSINEYNQMHIKNSISLPYTKIIKRRLLNDKISIIELLIKNSLADFLIDNKHECNIVVYDNKSEHTNQLEQTDSLAPILLNKLTQKFKSVSFLIGGFVNFYSKYPDLCEKSNANVFHSVSMDISPSSAACSSSEFSSPSNNNTEDVIFLKPKLNHSLSTHESSSLVSANQTSSRGDLFQFLSPITQANENVLREPTKILDFLYLGSQEDSLSEKTMKALNITNVLNVSIQCPKPEFIQDAHFLRIPLNDGHAAKILPFFDVAYRFIEKCRRANSNVLIHCLAGISRSPTLAIAYLMKHKKIKSDEAYEYVKERRPTISPNFNFLGQLYEYEKIQQQELNNKQSDTTSTTTTTTTTTTTSTKNTNNKETTTITTNTTTTTTNLPFLKFAKKQQSAINIFEASAYSQIDLNKSQQQQQRKKQFIFQFNSNVNIQENILSPQLHQPQMIKSSLTFGHLLPSPSQAFSNFNLNSPSTQSAQKSILNSFESITSSNTGTGAAPTTPSTNLFLNTNNSANLPKSFTINNINDFNSENKVIMRRPTNLQMDTNGKINNLKRPSSILLETNNNMNTNDFNSTNNNATTTTNTPIINNSNGTFVKPTPITSNLSPNSSSRTQLNSTSSTSSSCSSSASSSSASSTLMTTLINNQQIQQQQQQQQQHQKKIKLSPIQDRNILANFNLLNSDIIPVCLKSQSKLEDLNVIQKDTEQAPVYFRSKFVNNSTINESKSLETIRTVLESPTYQASNKSLELDDYDDDSVENYLNEESSYSNDPQLNLKSDELCSTLATNILKSSSNSSSSKPNSNKNSLHGSIEKMIEVS